MSEDQKTIYEVWGFAEGDFLEFTNDDPIRICHWLRQVPRGKRMFNIHPRGPGYHRDKVTAYEFLRKHEEALLHDIIRTAFEKGSPDGVAKDIIDLFYGQ